MSQKILVTGTSTGFGKLFVQSLLKAGHSVAASLRDAKGRNKASAEELSALGAKVVEMDVTDEGSVEAGVKKALEALGGLDVVVNNAGVGVLGWQEAFTVEDWRKVFEVNVFGVQRVNRAVLPHMRLKRSGLLIHISSLLGRMVIPFYGPYNATKHALEAMADNYRVELSGFGVESVLVEPGGYATDFPKGLLKSSDRGRVSEYGPMAEAPERSIEGFMKIFEGPNAPDPQWVADAVVGLVGMPRGKRPFRTVVDRLGMGAAVEPYNQAAAQVQSQVYGAFGMADLLTLKS